MNERLRRLLLLVPLASARPGLPVAQLAAELGCTADELQADIELLGLVGAPPFNPDDCIEIEELDGRVYVRLPQGFDRPTRLTSTEAAVLAAAARAAAPADPVLARAEEKISNAVQPAQRALYDALRSRLVVPEERPASGVESVLQEGIERRKEVEIDYFARTDLGAKPRRVRPRVIASVDGVPYLSARKANGEDRWYRMDRIAAARITDVTFEPLPSVEPDDAVRATARFDRNADLPRATVRFGPTIADAARHRHVDARPLADGSVDADVSYASTAWLVSYVLSWGGRAHVLGPEEPRAAFVAAVRRALEQHAD